MRLEKLLDQVAVGAMDLDAIESGVERVARSLPEAVYHAGDFTGLERTRRLIGRGLSISRHRLQRRRNRHRGRRNRQHTARLERGMRNPSHMPELQKDRSTFGMNCIDDTAPTLDLLLRIDARRAGVSMSRRYHRGGFRDDQSSRRGPLTIVFSIQPPRRERM